MSGHDHDDQHDHDHDHAHGGHHHHHHGGAKAPASIARAILITALFMVIELVGGIKANSLALVSDAAHMLTDIGALSLSLFALWVARRPSTRSMSFGYYRAEILGALVSGLLIWLIAGGLVYEAIQRLRSPPEVEGRLVFVIATIGLLANTANVLSLRRSKESNINVRAAYTHVLADAIGSVGAIIAGAVLWTTGWRPIDPLVTVIFSLLMLYSSWGLVSEAVGVLMESTPRGTDADKVHADLSALPGVRQVHDLHIWSVSAGRLALSVHLVATGESERLIEQANALLDSRHRIGHTTIQVEHPDRFRSDRCYDCAGH